MSKDMVDGGGGGGGSEGGTHRLGISRLYCHRKPTEIIRISGIIIAVVNNNRLY